MSTASFIQAMPKVELNLHLEGAILPNTLKLIADQNEISESLKHYGDWVSLINQPDYTRLYEIARMACSWLKQGEDLTRVVYDLGTALAKQNVRYVEVGINPTFYPDLNLSYDGILGAITDGRDRAKRAWGVDMNWIFNIPRDDPRRADDLARWTTTANAQRGGVVALGVSGDENAQPVGQFERAFHSVEKKEIARVARAGDGKGAEGVAQTIETLHPNRIVDGRGAADSEEVLAALRENDITLAVSLIRAQRQGWIPTLADYPLRRLYDERISLVVGTDMPGLYHSTINDEYVAAVDEAGLALDELENLALNAVRSSFLAEAAKAQMLETFTQAYAELRAEHIAAEAPAP